MIPIYAKGNSDFLYAALLELTKNGKKIFRRDQATLELDDVVINLTNPSWRVLDLIGRNDCLAATLFEMSWVLTGHNDIAPLEKFLPRAKDFSDDEVTWRAGYGPRLRSYGGVDQIATVIQMLSKDIHTRQAVIPIIHPDDIHMRGNTKDFPCNMAIHFLANPSSHEGQFLLDMKIFQRSMDVIWGSNINIFTWTVLQGAICKALTRIFEEQGKNIQVVPGTYCHFVSSLHLYERHFDIASNILNFNSAKLDRPGISSFGGEMYELTFGDIKFLYNYASGEENLFGVTHSFGEAVHDAMCVFDIYKTDKKVVARSNLDKIQNPITLANQIRFVERKKFSA